MHPYTGLGVLTLSPGQGYIRFETGLPCRRGDEVLPRMRIRVRSRRGAAKPALSERVFHDMRHNPG